MTLTCPWGNGLKMEDLEQEWDETTFPDDGKPFFDYVHKETGTKVYQAQHPEFELWSRGIHADQEAARVLGESIDYSRQAQAAAYKLGGGSFAADGEARVPVSGRFRLFLRFSGLSSMRLVINAN